MAWIASKPSSSYSPEVKPNTPQVEGKEIFSIRLQSRKAPVPISLTPSAMTTSRMALLPVKGEPKSGLSIFSSPPHEGASSEERMVSTPLTLSKSYVQVPCLPVRFAIAGNIIASMTHRDRIFLILIGF